MSLVSDERVEEMLAEIDRLRAERAELLRVLRPLLDHYLDCYDGNMDQLAHDATATLAKAEKL